MDILSVLPPELVTLVTWLVYLVSACAVVLLIAVLIGKIFGGFSEDLIGWFR